MIMKKNLYIHPITDVAFVLHSYTLCGASLGIGEDLGGGDSEENAFEIP